MTPLLNKVLIVEDSVSIRRLVGAHIAQIAALEHVEASTFDEVKELLEVSEGGQEFLCAVLDLNLPDAPHGEVVDLVQQYDIPVIVLTGSLDSAVKQTMDAKLIVDYVIKRNMNELEYVASLVENIYKNQFTKVIVVDDSSSFRSYLSMLLTHLRYIILTASDGVEALNIIAEHPDITLVITDYNMPKMNGLALIEEIRRDYKREEMGILGMSVAKDSELTVQLLKTGANDYMTKPIMVDEFYCRVSQSVNMVRNVRIIKESSTTDYLTKISNRRSLFDLGNVLYANARRETLNIAVAMIDADYFKRINDNFGHDAGDKVLVSLAATLKKAVRTTDVVARFGGEEFVCVTVVKHTEDALEVFERLRSEVEQNIIDFNDQQLKVTISIGVTTELGDSFEEMINRADKTLYRAKSEGRNRVLINQY